MTIMPSPCEMHPGLGKALQKGSPMLSPRLGALDPPTTASPSSGLSQAERCFLKAKEVYRREGIYGSDEKDVVGLQVGTCTGAELDSSPYTRSLGLALLGPPREKRIALAAITLETARLAKDHGPPAP